MDVIGGGVLVAAAAALWIAYLLPSWLRRRQYLATERNAVRLQQTLRILAETAETPEAVRVEATAREVATQQRILHEHEQAARLAAEAAEQLAIAERVAAQEAAELARGLAASVRAPATEPIAIVGPTEVAAVTASTDAAAARRALRRRRGRFSLLLLASLLTAIGGLVAAAFGASLLIAGGGAVGVVVAFAGIARLARVRVPSAPAAPVVLPDSVPFEPIELAEPEDEEHGWMPQPLPKPLHLSRGTIAAMAMASIEEAAELKRAAAEAEVARRAEELEPPLPSITAGARQAEPPAAGSAPDVASERRNADSASPYARMGIIDDARPALDDLDAVLRRRRQAG
ncbi:hypothetical protein [Agromyces bauzanensis]